MRNVIGYVLLVILVVGVAFIFLSGRTVLRDGAPTLPRTGEASQPGIPAPPEAPQAPTFGALDLAKDAATLPQQVSALQQQVALYSHQVTAYQHRVDAYKSQIAATDPRARQITAFNTVVKETIVPLLTPILTALVGYAFVKAGAEVAAAKIAAQHGTTKAVMNV